MRHLRITVALAAALFGLLGVAQAPAGASTDRRTLLIATEDVTGNEWDGTYYQRYDIVVARNGTFTGTGTYVGWTKTRDAATAGAGVRCGLTQTISGKVGDKASYKAQYDAPESAYWYNFKGSILGDEVRGTGVNVNGQKFEIRTATELEMGASICRKP